MFKETEQLLIQGTAQRRTTLLLLYGNLCFILMQASNLDILKKPKVKNSKLKEKLKVSANFDKQVTKYFSNGHKNPLFSFYL